MFYLRRKDDGNYFYYMSGDSTSMSSKYKDAIPFNDLDTAKGMKKQIETLRNEKFEIVEIKTIITVLPDEETEELAEE